ncbi:MAG TPA: glycerol-3-phosphate dehydrogenase/oxidase [Bacteroidales bacterium]|nr:glycerol-3-phosphate dehydrogenase/oxidase [Bacteroidales bacterium]
MNRTELTNRLGNHNHDRDIIVIGGGATGAGIALDAVYRNYDTLLLEQEDFGKGTSSRSTKLIHGGVRYLAQGDLVLVFEALRERGRILKNAPHITFNQQFIVPVYSAWEAIKYTIGLKFYDLLAGKLSLGKSQFIGRSKTLAKMPGLNEKGLLGGVIYHDGQFDDTRLLIDLVRSVNDKGGICLNYCRVTGLLKDNKGSVCGVRAIDTLTGKEHEFRAKVVVNATGVFTDDIIRMDQPVMKRTIRPSQGIHLVLDSKFLPGDASVMIPKTDDGRVLFAIPWYNKVVVGTTDTVVDEAALEPKALEKEIDFILNTTLRYFKVPPQRKDILTVFAGLRPLVASPDDPSATRELSRRHKISISSSGLVTVEGGKWTIYRRMAEDTIDRIIRKGMLQPGTCRTGTLRIYGADGEWPRNDRLHIYGSDAHEIKKMEEADPKPLHPDLPYTKAEITWICRNEMPQKLEDMLARRTRSLFLNARASVEIAPVVAAIMASEMGFDGNWQKTQVEEYTKLAANYIIS